MRPIGRDKITITWQGVVAVTPVTPSRCWLAAALAIALAAAGGAQADSTRLRSTLGAHYRVSTWTGEQGLPQNTVNCVLQTRDGYLWAGTRHGLVRFDGLQITAFTDSLSDVSVEAMDVRHLAEDREGRLWLQSRTTLVCLHKGRFHSLPSPRTALSSNYQKILPARHGGVWVAHTYGLTRWDGTNLSRTIVLQSDPRIRVGELDDFFEDSQQRLWLRIRHPPGRYWWARIDPRTLSVTSLADLTGVDAPDIGGVTEDASGTLWLARPGELISFLDGDIERVTPAPWRDHHVKRLTCGSPGEIWTISEGPIQLHRFRNGSFTSFGPSEGISNADDVRCAVPDLEENLWVGTGSGGLARLQPRRLLTRLTGSYSTQDEVYSIYRGRGQGVWLATAYGLVQFRENEFKVFTNTAARQPDGWTLRTRIVLEDHLGTVWAGLPRGLWTLEGDRFFKTELPPLEGGGKPLITTLFEDHRGVFWAGTPAGVLERKKDGWRLWGTNEGLSDVRVFGIAEGPPGTLWIGTERGGIQKFCEGRFRAYTMRDGLLSPQAWPLLVEADGTAWLGTPKGLNRIRGDEVRAVTKQHGLHDNLAYCLLEDRQDRYWSFCNRGIWRVNKADLHAAADGRQKLITCVSYGEEDGMASAEGNGDQQPNACALPSGEFWFPTTRGVVTLDPAQVHDNPVPPGVIIEQVRADDETLFKDNGYTSSAANGLGAATGTEAPRTLSLPPGRARTLEFHYTATTFVDSARARFRYRLDGYECAWHEVGPRRVALYTNLRPGHYRFVVEACNFHGYWAKVPAHFAFTLQPHFYETWGFRLLSGLAIAGMLGGWHFRRLRWRGHLQALGQERAVHEERGRIAKDLHDDLGASLTGIAMQIEVARRELSRPETAECHLRSIAESARSMVDRMRDVVWSLNPQCDTIESFCAYVSEFATGFLQHANLRCRLDLPDEVPHRELSAETRHHLVLVVKEALNNAARHAHATEVRLSLALADDVLAITIADNGRGLSRCPVPGRRHGEAPTPTPPMPVAQGRGIENMRRRVASIGGDLAITTKLGLGTTIRVEVQLP